MHLNVGQVVHKNAIVTIWIYFLLNAITYTIPLKTSSSYKGLTLSDLQRTQFRLLSKSSLIQK